MSCLTHPLGHLLLSLKLHVHISRTCLNRPYKPSLGNLHGLDHAALLRESLQGRFRRGHLADPACGHKRHI